MMGPGLSRATSPSRRPALRDALSTYIRPSATRSAMRRSVASSGINAASAQQVISASGWSSPALRRTERRSHPRRHRRPAPTRRIHHPPIGTPSRRLDATRRAVREALQQGLAIEVAHAVVESPESVRSKITSAIGRDRHRRSRTGGRRAGSIDWPGRSGRRSWRFPQALFGGGEFGEPPGKQSP